jgi:hypothetical protein
VSEDGNNPAVETHYGIRYTDKRSGGTHITDYETDKAGATRAHLATRPGWPYSTQLLARKIRIGAWQPTKLPVSVELLAP